MALSKDYAVKKITDFYSQFLPKAMQSGMGLLAESVNSFYTSVDKLGASTEQAFSQAILLATSQIAYFDNPSFSTKMPASPSIEDRIAVLPNSSTLVNYLYAKASPAERAEAVKMLDSGGIGKGNFVFGVSLSDKSKPSLTDIKNSAGLLNPGADKLSHSSLQLEGINDSQQEFLIAMYIGAFGRAPENGGLKFWANDLKGFLATGMSQPNAFLAVSNRISDAGKANGEKGTNLKDHDYASFAYTNILGRAPDQGGLKYWVDRFDNATLTRGDFLAEFLGAAQHSQTDYAFLNSRIAVSEFAALEKISGDKVARPDMYAVIAGVSDNSSAQARIDSLVNAHGVDIVGVKSQVVYDTWMGY